MARGAHALRPRGRPLRRCPGTGPPWSRAARYRLDASPRRATTGGAPARACTAPAAGPVRRSAAGTRAGPAVRGVRSGSPAVAPRKVRSRYGHAPAASVAPVPGNGVLPRPPRGGRRPGHRLPPRRAPPPGRRPDPAPPADPGHAPPRRRRSPCPTHRPASPCPPARTGGSPAGTGRRRRFRPGGCTGRPRRARPAVTGSSPGPSRSAVPRPGPAGRTPVSTAVTAGSAVRRPGPSVRRTGRRLLPRPRDGGGARGPVRSARPRGRPPGGGRVRGLVADTPATPPEESPAPPEKGNGRTAARGRSARTAGVRRCRAGG